MPIQIHGVLLHTMSGTELSRVRTEFRLHLPELINKSSLESSGADIVMQSNGELELHYFGVARSLRMLAPVLNQALGSGLAKVFFLLIIELPAVVPVVG